MRLGLIGFGAIVRQTLASLEAAVAAGEAPMLEELVCLAREGAEGRAHATLDAFAGTLARRVVVVEGLPDLLARRPALVAEAAGHGAVRDYGPPVLAAGLDFLIVSAGALADDSLRAALDSAARASGARWSLCAGAVGGLDLLAAARLAGLREVLYVSRKPPEAWLGTPAERLLDLAALTAPVAFFEGDARQAARDFPQNANVAATIALAGAGFDATRVRLVADPSVTRNIHEINILSHIVTARFEIAGAPAPDNPKTSLTTAFALCADLLARLKSRA